MKADLEERKTELIEFEKDLVEFERQRDQVAEQVRADDYRASRQGVKK